MISFPSNNYPAIERPCAPFNDTDFIETPSFTPSEIVLADYLSYPIAQGTEVFNTVKISQISDSVGSYGTDQQVFQGTVQSKVKWATLANQTETYQTDVYRSSQYQSLFDITCPADTTAVDIYVIGQGGWASASGPKYGRTFQGSGSPVWSVYGPGSGSAGTSVMLLNIPAQEGVCFRGKFTSDPSQYGTFSTQLYAVNGSSNVILANASMGNWASDPNIGEDNQTYPGNGYVGLARGPGTGSVSNLTGSLLTLNVGNNGIDGIRWDYFDPFFSTEPNPPYNQPQSINQAVQFYDEFSKPYGSGGFFTNIYIDNYSGPGYLHGTNNFPNDAAVVVISYINT